MYVYLLAKYDRIHYKDFWNFLFSWNGMHVEMFYKFHVIESTQRLHFTVRG